MLAMIKKSLALKKRYASSSLARRLIYGAAWSVTGLVMARLITIFGTIVIVRLIGQELFGQYAIIQSTVSMTAVLAGMGLGVTATKYVAELKKRDPVRLLRILATTKQFALVGALIAAGIFVLGSAHISRLLNSPQLSDLLAISAIGILFASLDGYQNGVLLGFEAIRESVLGLLVATTVSVPLTIVLAATYGLEGAVYGMVFTSFMQFLASRWQMRTVMSKNNLPEISAAKALFEWGVILDTALPAFLAGLMVSSAYWVSHALLVNAPSGHSEMAVIGIVNQWFQVILFLPAAAGRIVLPVLTDSIAQKNAPDSRKILRAGILLNAIVILPVVGSIAIASPWIMTFYGDAFRSAWVVLLITVFAAGFVAIQSHVGNLIAATGRFWLGFAMNCGWAFIYIGLSWGLLEYGALGISLALLLAYIAHSIWVFSYVASWHRTATT